jgi:hypothetical protein
MNDLHETLLILNHFHGVIYSRTNYCERNKDFNLSKCVTDKICKKVNEGYKINEITEPFTTEISRDCADQKIIIHSYICLNIIDMFSFNDEYVKFFNAKNFEDENLKKRILTVLEKNSSLKKKIDWEQLKRFRNNVMAHNLRDDKNNKKLSINTFKELSSLLTNLQSSIEYSNVVLEMFKNIKSEFELEISKAINELKEMN